jgi:hypothetical protein
MNEKMYSKSYSDLEYSFQNRTLIRGRSRKLCSEYDLENCTLKIHSRTSPELYSRLSKPTTMSKLINEGARLERLQDPRHDQAGSRLLIDVVLYMHAYAMVTCMT